MLGCGRDFSLIPVSAALNKERLSSRMELRYQVASGVFAADALPTEGTRAQNGEINPLVTEKVL